LAGVIAAHTWLPVSVFQFSQTSRTRLSLIHCSNAGWYSRWYIAIGEAGAKNAALLAAAILALSDEKIRKNVEAFRRKQSDSVLAVKLPK